MTNIELEEPEEPTAQTEGQADARRGELSEQEWKDLGSAEANAWTITPAGTNTSMSLDEHAAHQAKQEVGQTIEQTPDGTPLGSVELGLMTVIVDGVDGQAMTLSEHAAYQAKLKADDERAQEAMGDSMRAEAEERAAAGPRIALNDFPKP